MEKTIRVLRLSFVTVALVLQSCDEIYECLFNIEPEIHNKSLATATLGERYSDLVTAEIRNEVNDNDYDYDFYIVGELPPGIFYDINRRSVTFYGFPEEAGTYRFNVELSVSSYDYNGYDSSPTCSDSTVRAFMIRVVE
ncbi:MAG: hypothetical protein AAGB24_16045 [Bacteroidota bacterium]